MKAIGVCLVVVLLLQLVSEGESECCHGKGVLWKAKCADCSKGTPYCPRGKSCNIFGCNCDGGCRTGPCHHHSSDYYPAVVTEEKPVYQEEPAEEKPQDNDYQEMPAEETPQEDKPSDSEPTKETSSNDYYDDFLLNEDPYSADNPKMTADDIIQAADDNGDGKMDADEAESYLYKRGLKQSGYRLKRSLIALDLNNDNFISADEIDPDQ